MLLKIILFFLLAMVLLGMVGKALFPGAMTRGMRRVTGQAKTCRNCGRPLIGRKCDCGEKGKRT